jgi:hypothetical protein
MLAHPLVLFEDWQVPEEHAEQTGRNNQRNDELTEPMPHPDIDLGAQSGLI